MSRQLIRVSLVLLGVMTAAGTAAAQAPEGHQQHHSSGAAVEAPVAPPPPSPAPPPAPPPSPAAPGAPPSMMREMERRMGGEPTKPLVARVLDVERMTETDRNALRGDADRRVQEGLALLERGARELAEARRRGDEAALTRAVQTLEDGAAQWHTGRAVLEALSSPAPRAAGTRWFKSQMNLEIPAAPPSGIGGLSWRHAAVMTGLALLVAAGVALYVYKLRRSLALLARLTRADPRP